MIPFVRMSRSLSGSIIPVGSNLSVDDGARRFSFVSSCDEYELGAENNKMISCRVNHVKKFNFQELEIMNFTKKMATSLLLFGSVSTAQAAMTTYDVEAWFSEPMAANDTLFTGSFVWDDVAMSMSDFSGTMNSSMTVATTAPNLILDQNFSAEDSGSLNNTPAMTTYSVFAVDSGDVFNGGGHVTGDVQTFGNKNAYFSLSFDSTFGPESALAENMVYGDCTDLGLMMGMFCMGGEKNGVTMMAGVPQSLSVSAVPLPAAAWLFGSALLGLLGIKHRKAMTV